MSPESSPYRMLRLSEFFQFIGEGRTNVYTKSKLGLLPPPIKVGSQACGYLQREAEAINRARAAGKSPEEMKELTRQLIAQRAAGMSP